MPDNTTNNTFGMSDEEYRTLESLYLGQVALRQRRPQHDAPEDSTMAAGEPSVGFQYELVTNRFKQRCISLQHGDNQHAFLVSTLALISARLCWWRRHRPACAVLYQEQVSRWDGEMSCGMDQLSANQLCSTIEAKALENQISIEVQATVSHDQSMTWTYQMTIAKFLIPFEKFEEIVRSAKRECNEGTDSIGVAACMPSYEGEIASLVTCETAVADRQCSSDLDPDEVVAQLEEAVKQLDIG
jgi:hypothetical protein